MSLIELTRDGDVAILTMNDPDRRNALSVEMRAELLAKLDPLMGDDPCCAIVLTGAGGTFSAGGDLKSMRSGAPIYARHRMMSSHRLVRLLAEGPKPVVSAVEGFAFGAGLSLAALSDICVTAPDAKFGAVFGKVGLMADLGLLWSLPQRIGAARAKRFLLRNEIATGTEALALGLADAKAEAGATLAEAVARAQAFAGAAPLALAATRSAFAQVGGSLSAALSLEVDLQSALMASNDHAEGRGAFLDKRKPSFNGT